MGLTKVVAKVDPPVTQTQDNPDESTVDSDTDTLTKQVWKPLKKVADLLTSKGVLAPGIQ